MREIRPWNRKLQAQDDRIHESIEQELKEIDLAFTEILKYIHTYRQYKRKRVADKGRMAVERVRRHVLRDTVTHILMCERCQEQWDLGKKAKE